MSVDGQFITSRATIVPGSVMEKVQRALAEDRDWQAVADEYLRPLIDYMEADTGDELSEVNEVLREAEVREEFRQHQLDVVAESRR